MRNINANECLMFIKLKLCDNNYLEHIQKGRRK